MNAITDIVDPEMVVEVLLSHLRENGVLPNGPRAWTIGYSNLGGRGMFATRDIKPDELIFIDVPLLIGPRCINKNTPICVCCYKSECPLFPCDRGCGLPVCSTECENSPQHANECEYLRSLVPTCGTDWSINLLFAVIPIRSLFMTEQQRTCLAALQCHEALSRGDEVNLLLRTVEKSPSEDEIKLMKRVCGAFNTNSFETVSVQDKDHSTSLRALYPMGAMQNHCCAPNTRHHCDGQYRLYVSAALPISAGEELTMSYTSLFWDTLLRRQFLSATKYFFCKCKRCRDSTEFGSKLGAILCASENCWGSLLPQDSLNPDTIWVCDRCTTSIKSRQVPEHLNKLRISLKIGLAALVEEVLQKPPRKILRFMQKEFSALLPATNYLMMDLKFRIVSYFGRTEGLGWSELSDAELIIKRNYCNDLLSSLDTMNCGNCRTRGLILYELYCTNIEINKRLGQQQNDDRGDSQHLPQINLDDNDRLFEKAINILQNDVLSVTLLENDKKLFQK